jgi:hypothetical protein
MVMRSVPAGSLPISPVHLICRHAFWLFPMSSYFVNRNIRIADIIQRQALDISGGFDGINDKGY